MSARSTYKTKQREILLDYLETVPGVHITASDVCEYFKKQGSPIGQSTVYRQLERLVDEGIINKYIIDGNSPACFEYVGAEIHSGPETCFHCKCEKCGKLIHLHCEELAGMQEHLRKEHQFTLNAMRTVFYGLCEQCS
ncbi:MAG: transcriptional repressor [Lachnospiraceae bacterium]|nr:transcriptional repressor [Lachnospiraceae bacterium]